MGFSYKVLRQNREKLDADLTPLALQVVINEVRRNRDIYGRKAKGASASGD